MRRNFWPIILALGLISMGGLFLSQKNSQTAQTPTISVTPTPVPQTLTLSPRTKTTNCQAQNGLPDKACTPGAVFATTTKDQVCTPGYSKSVRDVGSELKAEVYKEYGITSHQTGEYEVDHLISLELGGTNDISNLWPEAADPKPGFHEKDQVENYLNQQVCSGAISLQQAQQEISTNWLQVYQQLPH